MASSTWPSSAMIRVRIYNIRSLRADNIGLLKRRRWFMSKIPYVSLDELEGET